MTRFKLLGATAAVVLSTALAGPVMAQQVITNPGKCAQYYPNANCQNLGPGNPYTGTGYRHRAAYRHNGDWNNNGWNNHDTGFWPGDVAAGVVGGAVGTAAAITDDAVGTAGAIATAPFRGDSYAYYNGYYNSPMGYNGPMGYGQSYAERNGFVCQPGTWFKGEDGRRHICQ
jgi:glycosidase